MRPEEVRTLISSASGRRTSTPSCASEGIACPGMVGSLFGQATTLSSFEAT